MVFRDLTSAHIRAARALLNWTQQTLSDEANLAVTTIKRFETKGLDKASIENVDKISIAFANAGIEFFNGGEPGVRLRKK